MFRLCVPESQESREMTPVQMCLEDEENASVSTCGQ
jgi:hypothetical protein